MGALSAELHCHVSFFKEQWGLSERHNSELAKFGGRWRDELQQMVHWAKAPPIRPGMPEGRIHWRVIASVVMRREGLPTR